jgi:sugar lactone lactonase YvrE
LPAGVHPPGWTLLFVYEKESPSMRSLAADGRTAASRRRRGSVVALLATAPVLLGATAVFSAPTAGASVATPSTTLVIAAAYGGGGGAKSYYGDDFVELFNASSSPQSLGGLSVQEAGEGGTVNAAETTALNDVTLQPGQYFLLAGQNAGAGSQQAFPVAPDQTNPALGIEGDASAVFLVNGTATVAPNTDPSIIDEVGWGNGTGDGAKGTDFLDSAAGTLTQAQAVVRLGAGCTNTNNNGNDFVVQNANLTAPVAPILDTASPARRCTDAPPPPPPLNLNWGTANLAEGVATDNNGAVYASLTGRNVVETGPDGADTVVAGSFEDTGETGDGGPATAATLNSPAGLAVDGAGDLFIADTENNDIREVTPDGNIKVVAGNGTEGYRGNGGPATAAELDNPQDVAVDAAGDLFIADTYNNVIREVKPSGTISTFAGNGTAGFAGDNGPASAAELTSPDGVAVDALGNVYVADTGNNVIRRVSTSGVITTVAGNVAADQANDGLGGDSGDGGPATAAQLDAPEGVAVDRAGDLYIADTFNDAIRQVTPAGVISTLAKDVNTATAVAVDNSTGDVYATEPNLDAIAQVSGLPIPGPAAGGPSASAPSAETPESPLAVSLPLAALGIGAVAFAAHRRRTRRHRAR